MGVESSISRTELKDQDLENWAVHPGGGGTPIHYLYGYVPPNGVAILKLLV